MRFPAHGVIEMLSTTGPPLIQELATLPWILQLDLRESLRGGEWKGK